MRDTILLIIVIIVILLIGTGLFYLMIKVEEWQEQAHRENIIKSKEQFTDCLQKTDNNIEWCFDKVNI